ncbi:MAG: hypothetical protein NZ898_15070 [Myxococcota bacterium]|nr:hypothetical protein [Myxococcota bacterium]MDW8363737.1 hypothetical protein [Myxococcales bacterium]
MDGREPNAGRRMVTRLPPGARLRAALGAAMLDHGLRQALVEGHGVLESIELEGGRRLAGAYDVPLLRGSVHTGSNGTEAVLHVLLVRSRHDGDPQPLLGGRLVDAIGVAFDLVLEELRIAESTADASARPRGATEPDRSSAVPTSRPISDAWAGAVAASAAAQEPSTKGPRRGDWVEHHRFGLCRVEREERPGALRIRLPDGSFKSITLDVLEVLPARVDGRRRIIPLRPRTRADG